MSNEAIVRLFVKACIFFLTVVFPSKLLSNLATLPRDSSNLQFSSLTQGISSVCHVSCAVLGAIAKMRLLGKFRIGRI